MKLSEKQHLFTQYVALLIQYAYKKGFRISMGEVYRTPAQQKIYFDKGYSQTLSGQHQKKLAIDIHLFKKVNGEYRYMTSGQEYRTLGEYWEKLDKKNRWGGKFGLSEKDYSHKVGWDFCHYEYFN